MTSAATAVMTVARSIMDRALAAPNGIKLYFPDADHGGSENAKQLARTWTSRMYSVRSYARKVQERMANPNDVINGMTSNATDPDVFRTAYDAISCDILRDATHEAGPRWVLNIAKVTLEDLNWEEF